MKFDSEWKKGGAKENENFFITTRFVGCGKSLVLKSLRLTESRVRPMAVKVFFFAVSSQYFLLSYYYSSPARPFGRNSF